MTATIQVRVTPWGRWFHELIQQPKLEQYDIAEMNLRCAVDLPGMKNELVKLGIDKINEWTDRVENFTKTAQKRLRGKRRHFTEAQFCVVAMIECLQRHIGIKFNFGFMKGEYDASDSRNLFIHGVLTGFGGTCASLAHGLHCHWS
ncbi:hypothetical protein DTL42_05100 [Bremerella cremea]|uniref:Uncharacterized protein n=1 Tax=Bremerella cremea TaxID=1031537 RepID=A0A368KVY2_9BACT|nr:hypothetical protein [Bremerella cremea]RCS54519.1 hypothetical protein DTL42_05100 [Bremerella cremea]